MNDEDLVREFKLGSIAAVELLIQNYYQNVYKFLFWKTRDPHLSWDLTQSAFEKAWLALNRYEPSRGSFRVWILAIAQNVWIDYMRSPTARQTWMELPESMTAPDSFEDILMDDEMQVVWRAIELLPIQQREVIMLRYREDFSYPDIAVIMGVPEGTVKSRCRLGLCKLRKILTGNGNVRKERIL